VEDELPKNEIVKQAACSGHYYVCRKGGLDGLAEKFGLTHEQFGENLWDNYQCHEVEQEPTEPMEAAKEYNSNKFTIGEEVLEGAKFMVAIQLSHDPLVRRCICATFLNVAKSTISQPKRG
jgi:transcription elongation factor SPT6